MLRGHHYKEGTHGRRLKSRLGIGSPTLVAYLQCSRCPTEGTRNLRQVIPPDQIAKKFIQAGWRIDPHVCPTCIARPKEKPMGTTPTAAAIKGQVRIMRLLDEHFDIEAGRYAAGWSDEKIAEETGLAVNHVTEYRRAEFGEIKEPTELALIRADIAALEQLQAEQQAQQRDQNAQFAQDIATLRSRLATAAKTMGIAA